MDDPCLLNTSDIFLKNPYTNYEELGHRICKGTQNVSKELAYIRKGNMCNVDIKPHGKNP